MTAIENRIKEVKSYKSATVDQMGCQEGWDKDWEEMELNLEAGNGRIFLWGEVKKQQESRMMFKAVTWVGGLLGGGVTYWLWKGDRKVKGAHGKSEMSVSQQTRYTKEMVACGSLGIP